VNRKLVLLIVVAALTALMVVMSTAGSVSAQQDCKKVGKVGNKICKGGPS
jgi:hypothetical protein